MNSTVPVQAVVTASMLVFELFSTKEETYLIRWNSFFFAQYILYVLLIVSLLSISNVIVCQLKS